MERADLGCEGKESVGPNLKWDLRSMETICFAVVS